MHLGRSRRLAVQEERKVQHRRLICAQNAEGFVRVNQSRTKVSIAQSGWRRTDLGRSRESGPAGYFQPGIGFSFRIEFRLRIPGRWKRRRRGCDTNQFDWKCQPIRERNELERARSHTPVDAYHPLQPSRS